MSRPYTLYCRNQQLVLTQNSKQDHYYTRHILDFPISLYRAPLQKEFNAVKKKYGPNNPALSFLITILKWILILIYILFDLVFFIWLWDFFTILYSQISHINLFFRHQLVYIGLNQNGKSAQYPTEKVYFLRGRGGGYNYLKVCNCYITGRKARRPL